MIPLMSLQERIQMKYGRSLKALGSFLVILTGYVSFFLVGTSVVFLSGLSNTHHVHTQAFNIESIYHTRRHKLSSVQAFSATADIYPLRDNAKVSPKDENKTIQRQQLPMNSQKTGTSISILSRRTNFDRYSTSKLFRITNDLCANKNWDEEHLRDAQKVFSALSKRSKSQAIPSKRKTGRSLISSISFEVGMHRILRVLTKVDSNLSEGWYLAAIEACGRCDNAVRSEKILDEMIAKARCQNSYITGKEMNTMPSTKTFNAVIDAWSKSSDENAAERAEAILVKMLDKDSRFGAIPNVITFNNVINAWSKKDGAQCGEQAERVFRRMMDLHSRSDNNEYKPTIVSYNVLMNAWANSMRTDSLENVERIFQEMLEARLAPDNFSYSSLLMALANSSDRNMVNKADVIIRQIEDLDVRDDSDVNIDCILLNTIMNVWLRCDQSGISDNRALDIVSRMESSSNESMRPDTVTYNILMNIYANLDNNGERVETILKKMKASNDKRVAPDLISYNTVLNSWAKSGNARKAQLILEDMEKNLFCKKGKIIPDQITFHTVIDAWAYSQEDCAADNAEQLLERMDLLHRQGFKHLKPTSQTYNMVLNAWSKSQSPEASTRAQKILLYMEEGYKGGNLDVKPDVVAFTTVMDTIAKSKEKGKARAARDILTRMNAIYNSGDKLMRPNVISYGTVLNACAYTFIKDDKEEALAIAKEIFQEIKTKPWLNRNHIIYASFFKVIAKCIPRRDERREALVRPIFRECCLSGQVSSLVLENLRSAVPIEVYNDLLGEEHNHSLCISVDDLPKSWTCNAAKKHSRSTNISASRKTSAGSRIQNPNGSANR